jgi:hypothetical protein
LIPSKHGHVLRRRGRYRRSPRSRSTGSRWPGEAVISSLPEHALPQLVLNGSGRSFAHARRTGRRASTAVGGGRLSIRLSKEQARARRSTRLMRWTSSSILGAAGVATGARLSENRFVGAATLAVNSMPALFGLPEIPCLPASLRLSGRQASCPPERLTDCGSPAGEGVVDLCHQGSVVARPVGCCSLREGGVTRRAQRCPRRTVQMASRPCVGSHSSSTSGQHRLTNFMGGHLGGLLPASGRGCVWVWSAVGCWRRALAILRWFLGVVWGRRCGFTGRL